MDIGWICCGKPTCCRPTRALPARRAPRIARQPLSDHVRCLEPCARTRHSERVVAWLRQQCRQHAELTLGVPDSTHERVARWVGPRLIWWPRGVPPGRRVSIVSSRLGRLLERHRPWFAALRTVCRDLDPDSELLTAARDTATAPYLTRCSELFRIPLLLWELPPRRQAMSRWLVSCRQIVHSQNGPATAPLDGRIVAPLVVRAGRRDSVAGSDCRRGCQSHRGLQNPLRGPDGTAGASSISGRCRRDGVPCVVDGRPWPDPEQVDRGFAAAGCRNVFRGR